MNKLQLLKLSLAAALLVPFIVFAGSHEEAAAVYADVPETPVLPDHV